MGKTELVEREWNKDIIWLLESVLDACTQMAEWQKEKGTSYIKFKNKDGAKYFSTEGHFAHQLFRCVYDAHKFSAIEKDKASIKIVVKSGEKEEDKIVQTMLTEFKQPVPLSEDDEAELIGIVESLQKSFLPEEDRSNFCLKIDEMLRERDEMRKDYIFPSVESIEHYLESYYNTLFYLMNHEEIIQSSGEAAKALRILLRLDSRIEKQVEDNQTVYQGSLLSPMALNAMRKMYIGVEQYYRILTKKNISKELCLFYKNVIIKKVQHLFRWYMDGEDGTLLHSAVASYAKKELHEGCLCVQTRDIKQYNSFEGICELRVAEKIIYEIDQLEKENNVPDIMIVSLLGDISGEEMVELTNYLQGVLVKKESSLKIIFKVYTKNVQTNLGEDSDDVRIKTEYYSDLDEQFTDRDSLGEILKESQITFMLDCISLYAPIDATTEMSASSAKQRFFFRHPFGVILNDAYDFALNNYFDDMYEMMTVYQRKGTIGRFKKRANEAILQFCEEWIRSSDNLNHHSLYAYVSDIGAFENTYCSEHQYVRMERYNQKKIGIIRYADKWEKSLPITCTEKVLCFNVWQIIKHIDLEDRLNILDTINEQLKSSSYVDLNECDLHRLFIGIDYKAWPEKLVLHYGVKDARKKKSVSEINSEQFAQYFLEKVVLPIFNEDRDNLFQQYFWKAMYSLLYGNAQSVQDMLFIHLLQDGSQKVGKAVIPDTNDAELVINSINTEYKYSIKRFYEMILHDYDISAEHSFCQLNTAYIIGKNADDGTKALFKNVVEACKRMKYEDSYLYKNCIRM